MGDVIDIRAAWVEGERFAEVEAFGVVGPFRVSVARSLNRPAEPPIALMVEGGRGGRNVVGRYADDEVGRELAGLLADVVLEALALAEDEWCPGVHEEQT